ncbi:hypothetical protein JG688_00015586 [Phytophthora aleatoria]|uniref:Uncharacterized protein n=1 Tax=Phytophthora aleatoria TaxID=2496075 RepID=A0A8J5IVF3_9STRA|nr:hypothetical protein JG688_00015586 [Phytophthora aleatoria]
MSHVVNILSEQAWTLIFTQYHYTKRRDMYQFYEAFPDALDEPRAKFVVTKRNWERSCLLMPTRLLPCRRVFFNRRELHT